MQISGPPRPKGTPKDSPPVDEETTAVQALPAPAEPDFDVTVAEPPSDDLLETRELPVVDAAPDEPEDPNKAYLAPQVLPTPAVPDQTDAQRIVLNLPDQSAVLPPSPQDVDRARRRAPTVKIPRGTLAAQGAGPVEPAAALPPAPPPAPRPPPAAAATVATVSSSSRSALADDPKPLLSLPNEPRIEAPPTARHVSAPPPARRSKLPWIALAALCLGAGGFALLTLTKEEGREAASREPAKQTAGQGVSPTSQPKPEPSPLAERPAPAPEPAKTTEPETTATAAASVAAPAPTPTPEPVAVQTPPSPPVKNPAPAAPPTYKPPPAAAPPAATQKGPAKPPSPKGDYTPPTI
ncbi:MAG: hypothetical protein JNL21_36025 [Myxococcales bacterium]|nr:hypothetical protein [Myxococcales bacterium]